MGSSTGTLLLTKEKEIERVFLTAKEKNIPLTVHAELEEMIQKGIKEGKEKNWNNAKYHNLIRKPEAEAEAIKKALKFQKKIGNRIHFCHVTTKKGLKLIEKTKNEKRTVSCEVSPHHLFLSEEDLEKLGNFGKMNPPLRSLEEQRALWEHIGKGTVDCIATDHAPHTIEEKEKDYFNAPSGVTGVETLLSLMLNALNEERITLKKIVELCCENPARVFKLKGKGRIAEGADADLVIVEKEKEIKIKNENLSYKCKWSPFNEWKLKGKAYSTIVNGEIVLLNEEIFSNKKGKLVGVKK